MTICLIGKNLTTLMLTKIFINEGLRVDLYDFNNKKHKKLSNTISRTIGLSNDSINFLESQKFVNIIGEIAEKDDETDQSFDLIKQCIEHVFTADGEMHSFSEATDKEKDEFIDSMSTDQFMKMQEFFTTMPTLSHVIKIPRCVTCGQPFEHTLEGLANFF